MKSTCRHFKLSAVELYGRSNFLSFAALRRLCSFKFDKYPFSLSLINTIVVVFGFLSLESPLLFRTGQSLDGIHEFEPELPLWEWFQCAFRSRDKKT